jgi:arylsulfatase A-like enzyme
MGYVDIAGTPSTHLLEAMDYTDASIGKIVAALRAQKLMASTAIIFMAKHGQSPIDITKRQIIDEKLIPSIVNSVQDGLLGQSTADDMVFIWLKDGKKTPDVVAALKAREKEARIRKIVFGRELQLWFPDAAKDSRTPDLVVEPEFGVIYAKPNAPGIAEHGGFMDEDTHIPLMVALPGGSAQEIHAAVATAQIAPTILRLLGLDPNQLKAVQIEKTQVLPGLQKP